MAARSEAQRLTRAFDERLRPHDLTINQFSMLGNVDPVGPDSGLAARRLAGHRPNHYDAKRDTQRKRRLVHTTPGKDARERLVEVTALGRSLAGEALPAWRAAQKGALSEPVKRG